MGCRGRLSARRRAVLGEGPVVSLLADGWLFLRWNESLRLSVRMAVSFRISIGRTIRRVSVIRLPEKEAPSGKGSVCMAVSAFSKGRLWTGISVEMPTSTMLVGGEVGSGAMIRPFMELKGVPDE